MHPSNPRSCRVDRSEAGVRVSFFRPQLVGSTAWRNSAFWNSPKAPDIMQGFEFTVKPSSLQPQILTLEPTEGEGFRGHSLVAFPDLHVLVVLASIFSGALELQARKTSVKSPQGIVLIPR